MGTQRYSAAEAGANDHRGRTRLLIATVVLVLLLSVFIPAGLWQLDRARQKEVMLEDFAQRGAAAPLTRRIAAEDLDANRYRRMTLTGQYLNDRQVLLDNIVYEGRSGYQVLTPFRTATHLVMVNRGWVPADQDRRVLPYVQVSEDRRIITGRVNRFPEPGMRLAATTGADTSWPARMLYPDADDISALLGDPIVPYQLQLLADQADGYTRDWKAVDIGPDKHYGYTFQWFSFAALAVFFYIILNVRWKKQDS